MRLGGDKILEIAESLPNSKDDFVVSNKLLWASSHKDATAISLRASAATVEQSMLYYASTERLLSDRV